MHLCAAFMHVYFHAQTAVDTGDNRSYAPDELHGFFDHRKNLNTPNRGFHVMSYQANFASHHTGDSHVGFLFTWRVLENTTKCSVTFYLVHTKLPNYN